MRTHPVLFIVVAALASFGCGGERPGEAAAPARATLATLIGASYAVYVTNEMSGDLTVVDPARHAAVATVALGKRPRGIKVSPDHRHLYVALSGSPIAPPGVDESTLPPPDRGADGIGVVDAVTLNLIRVLRGPSDPEQTAVSADGRRLYIANEDVGTATILEIASGRTLAEFDVGGEPEGVTISPDGRFVYVTSEQDNVVSVIDTAASAVVAQFAVGLRPRDTAFSPDGTRAYVTGENDATVSVVDTATHSVIHTIAVPGPGARPMGVVVSPDGERVYVTTGRGGTIVAIDAANTRVLGSVRVGQRPWGLTISPDGRTLFSANGPSNDVSVVDAATLTLVATIPVGDRPWGVLAVPR